MADIEEGLKVAGKGLDRAGSGLSKMFRRLLGPAEALANSLLITLLVMTGYVFSMIYNLGYTDSDLDHLGEIWQIVTVKASVGGLFVFLLCLVYYKLRSGALTIEEE